ncbi:MULTISPECIES: ACT domain-containing protein [unclassified Mesotoga]|uniref:ACT domain-containing protein n=1 Tax=unclassified Mesotoga TaxID=1184398 RepID=UPI000DA64A39|nr:MULTISPECIES: ACT domain-containing protein [unclassified Mesotoga]PZC52710.1 CBS domain containing protein [Mesotoga sp. TolDC]
MNIDKWTNRTYPVFDENRSLKEILTETKKIGLTTIISVDKEGRLSGIARLDEISERDIPGLLSEVISEPVFYCRDSDFIEDAALMLIESHDYILPVVNDDFVVVGAIGVFEILEGLMEFTAMDKPGTRISIVLDDKPGALRDVVDFLAEREVNILSIITSASESEDSRRVVIRTDESDISMIAEILQEQGIPFESISEEEGFSV